MPSRPIFQPPRRRPTAPPRWRRAQRPPSLGPHVSLRYSDDDGGGIIIGGLDDTTFEHRQVTSGIRVLVDFDNDGDFDHPLEDITTYVQNLEANTGRDWPSQLTGRAGPGELRGVLTNTDDRFSYFNAASPLNTPPFSLKTGRRVRVCTVESENPDPVLLARDRFRRADGGLNTTENGLPWVNINAGYEFKISSEEAFATTPDDTSTFLEHIALIDLGVNDYYIQVTHGRLQGGSYAGIYYRYQDANNYGLMYRDSLGGMHLQSVSGGVATSTDLGNFGSIDNNATGTTIGVYVNGSTATAYIEGVPIGSATAAPFASTRVGMIVYWITHINYAPSIRRFDAWDRLPTETEGILWTGDLEDLVPNVVAGPYKTAAISALGSLNTAATTDISPEPSVTGYPTGIAIGHALAHADLLHPPGAIQQGDITTGPYGFDRQKALSITREFEATEFGFLREAQEGWINFDARTARDASYPLATFSDRPGTQYAYETITPRDWRRELINKVVAGIASGATDVNTITNFSDSNSTGIGVANDVNVNLPATGIGTGDLVLIIITSSVGVSANDVPWLNPTWWTNLRTSTGPGRQQVYVHVGRASDNGDSILFYDDTTSSGGAWHAEGFIIPRLQWYGSLDGVTITDHIPGDNPPPLSPPWGLIPSLLFVTHTGIVSLLGGSAFGSESFPQGYSHAVGSSINGASNQFDLAQEVAWRVDVTRLEDPTAFSSGANAGYAIVETCTLAVRGFNGLPLPTSTELVTVERQDTDSQVEHGNTVKTHTGPNLFANKGQAGSYCDRILGRYANDRPIFQIGFTATKGAGYRRQAIQRRVNHRIRLQADGNAGFGVDADYHIEHITHRFDEGCQSHVVLWELSPAESILRADTTDSELTGALAAADPGETSTWQVTINDGPLWVLTADQPNMFPIPVRVDQETILVDTITGGTSPQTFTGRRGFNGWRQAHSAGAAISLADPWVVP